MKTEKICSPKILEGNEYFTPVETHFLRSQHVPQLYKVQIMQPVRKRGDGVRFPVVYMTDANSGFDLAKELSHVIQASGTDATRFILVGIGYPGDSPRAGAVLRVRDFTAPGFPVYSPKSMVVGCNDILHVEDGTKEVHGADDFQNFIQHELVPFVDTSYDTIPGDRTYFGHSGGGQFGLYTLFTRTELFRNYVVSSPSLMYTGELDGVRYERHEYLFDDARRFVSSRKSIPDTRLYMSVGAEEEFEQAVQAHQLTSSLYRMAALLKEAGVAGLGLTMEAFPGETHMTAWPISFMHGIKAVLGRSSQ